MKTSFWIVSTLLLSEAAAFGALAPAELRCENRFNARSVDISSPRLSWVLKSDARGARQSAFQVLVASSPANLAKNAGDLWDSGQVKSDQNLHIRYAGTPLASAKQVFWKVRVWDERARVSSWSAPTQWTMGLLSPQDWRASWIGAPATNQNRKTIGYHAGETKQQGDLKWVQVDLGRSLSVESVRLHPMKHADITGFGFPLRFKVEVSNDADFGTPTTLSDQTSADFLNPGAAPVAFAGKNTSARFVRVTATKLAPHPTIAGNFAFALSQLEVVSGGKNVALNAPVAAKDSVEFSGWGKAGLTDGALNSSPDAVVKNYSSVLLRKEISVRAGLKRAVVFVCGLGQYEMSLNGAKVGTDLLAPGWTKYDKTCLYEAHDVSAQLKTGANVLGLFLGGGMYHVPGGRYSKFKNSFGPLRAIAHIRLDYADGSTQIIGSDTSWQMAPGPVTFSDVFGGEDFDARLLQTGWNRPGFRADGWTAPIVSDGPGGTPKGLSVANPPIRAFETFKPVGTKVLNPRTTVYDFGQNAAIIPRLVVRGAAGATVRLIPGENVKSDGSVDQTSSGGPSFWQYTLAGSGVETYHSPFQYRGCRFLQVETSAPQGAPLPIVQSLETVAVHASSPAIGSFESSNELFNRTYNLVRWAQRSNMMSVMTDCPHREKLGWLEETHLNGPSLRYNFDMSAMASKMMNDIADSQQSNGMVPTTAPEYPVFGGDFRDSPEWSSAFLMVPLQQLEFDGDDSLLRAYYPRMKRYVAYLGSRAKDDIVSFGLSDWYDIGPGEPGYSKLTPKGLTATAFYFQDTLILARTARTLGLTGEAKEFDAQAARIRSSFNAHFFNAQTHQYGSGSQAANSIPIVMGLCEAVHRAAVLSNIIQDVERKGLTAGDVGYRYLLRALADGGRSDVIYAMNNQSDKPGYGMILASGATSLTEAWDAHASSSQNHFMLGQINEWFFHDLAGIQCDPTSSGFKKIVIKPAVVGDLTRADATFNSPYGPIESRWTRANGQITLRISIPANTSATVYVPTSDENTVRESGKTIASRSGVRFLRREGGAAVFAVGSGNYVFTADLP